jgi:hypothetical protein
MRRIARIGTHPAGLMNNRVLQPAAAAPWESQGWWDVQGKTCLAAYQPIGAEDYADSLVNIANPGTYDAEEGTAPSWSAETGWTFNGSDDYLKTGITPSSTTTIIVRFTGLTTSFKALVVGNTVGLYSSDVSNRLYYVWGNGGNYDTSAHGASGVAALVGATSSGLLYWNGEYQNATGSQWATSTALYIGAANDNGTPVSFGPHGIQAVAIYSGSLSADEVAQVSDAMEALE